MRTRLALLIPLSLILGCPAAQPPATLTADITASTPSGPVPLTVMFSSLGSTSPTEIAGVAWDFGDGTTADSETPTHTFAAPGRYRVKLTITDPDGATSSAVEDIRVQGGPATAVIAASVTSGTAPLGVTFDGTGSSAADDTILDYYWDFGDEGVSRVAMPTHVYQVSGTYTVTLRAVTGGGVEASTTTMITVLSAASASLQFNGSQFATLPLIAGMDLTEWTFECWTRSGNAGGQVVAFGMPNVSISLDSSARVVRVVADSLTAQVSTPDLSSGWHHLAVTSGGGTIDVYIDGSSAGSAALDASTQSTNVLLGSGFQGNLYDARFWSIRREAADIAAGQTTAPSSSAAGLLGRWPLDDGSGQTLGSSVGGGGAGVLGASDAAETADPAWSTDSP